ncbi:MAG: hypothetical protein ABWX65_05935 [Mycetocola sp.]
MSVTRDQVIGRRAAVVVMLVTFVFVAIGPLWIAVNGFVSLATGIPGNMPDGPGVTTRDQMAGNFPFPMPSWVYIVMMPALPVLLAVVWKPERHTTVIAFGGKLLMWASPGFIAFVAMFCAIFAFDAGSWFPRADGSYGLHWIAGVIGLATAIVGGADAYRRWLRRRGERRSLAE